MTTETAAPADASAVDAPAAAPAATTIAGADSAPAPVDAPADKPADAPADKPVESKVEDKPADKPAGAPEKYEDFTIPEGAALDDQVLGSFAEVARELNLPQDAAQKVIDKVAPIMAARQAEAMEAMRNDWHAQSSADKEFGGDKLQETSSTVARVMTQFGTPELKAMLNESGLGNHPELVRLMVRVGKAMSEDKIVTGGQQPGSTRSLADRLYSTSAAKGN